MNIQLLAVLSLCSFNLLFCTDFPPKNTSPNNSEKIFESAKRKRLSKSFHREQNPKNFSEEDIAEIELFFKNSPEEAQQVVTDIEQGRDDLNNDHRFTIFFDDSESNHEKMSAIIAYKMYKQGWNCTFLSGKSLLGKNSDSYCYKTCK